MLSLFSLVLVFVGQSLASPSANQYVDTVLRTSLQNAIRADTLEPFHLGDFTFEYKDKTFFGKVNGKAEYTEGKMEGLSSVQRYNDCNGPRNVSGSTVIDCTLTFNNLNTVYKGKVKYGKLPKVSISPKGQVQYTMVGVQISKPFNSYTAQVSDFQFRSLGTINTDFTGLGPLNKQMKILEDNYRARVGAEVTNVLNSRFRHALNIAVSSVPMPSH